MRKTLSIILKIFNYIITAVLIIIIGVNIYIIGARNLKGISQPTVFGYSYAVVLSGSMADAINVDDIVITKKSDEYKTSDVIMFGTENMLVTHRVVDITEEGYITKGDANNAEDNWVIQNYQIVGKVIKIIPGAGKIIVFMQSPLGMLILVLIAFGLTAVSAFGNNKTK